MMDNNDFMETVLNTKNIDTTKQPMFLGEDLALQRYDRFKYPKFFDLWRKQEEFHWLPEEVSLTKDRNDYENLTDIEASDLLILYKEQHPDWKLEIQEYNFDPGGRHWGRDPDLH